MATGIAVPFDNVSSGVQSAIEGFTAGSVYVANVYHKMVSLVIPYLFTTKSTLHDFLPIIKSHKPCKRNERRSRIIVGI